MEDSTNDLALSFNPNHAAEVHFWEDEEPAPLLHLPVGDLRFL